MSKHDLSDGLERLFILRGEQGEYFTLSAYTSSTSAPVNVDLSIERALVVEHLLHIRYIEASCRNVSADKDGALAA